MGSSPEAVMGEMHNNFKYLLVLRTEPSCLAMGGTIKAEGVRWLGTSRCTYVCAF